MQGNINIKASGRIEVFTMIDKVNKILLTRHNEINLSMAGDIIARGLGNFDISRIDSIKAYNGALLYSANIDLVTGYSHPATGTVQYSVLFPGPAFSGDITRLELVASNMGIFAFADPVLITKAVNTPMYINWTIEVSAT